MKISIVTDTFNYGGGIEHIFQVVSGMPANTFRIHARPGDSLDRFAGLPHVETIPLGYNPALVYKANPDLIHIHHLRPLCAFFALSRRDPEIPVIYTAHGLHLHKYEFSRRIPDRLWHGLRFRLEKRLFNRVDRVVAVSRDDLHFIQSRFHLKRAVHIPNGIDPAPLRTWDGESADIDREFGLPPGRFLFITVARFDFQKGYDILVQAIARRRDEFRAKPARFLLVGDGPTLAMVRSLAESLDVADLIVFAGQRRDAHRLMKAADMLIHPSRWEGLPLVLLEAGLLKKPILASDACGNRELLENDRGLLFENENIAELADRISGVCAGRFPLDEYSQNLLRTITTDYSGERMLTNLNELYTSTWKEKRASRG